MSKRLERRLASADIASRVTLQVHLLHCTFAVALTNCYSNDFSEFPIVYHRKCLAAVESDCYIALT